MFPLASVLTEIEQVWSMIGVASSMKSIVTQALSGTSLVSMAKGILSGDLVGILEKSAETLFPKVAPELRLGAAVVAAYDHDNTKWLQQALNTILGLNLDVDGIYGKDTVAAVEQFQQTVIGLNVDGWAFRLTNAAIQEVMSKLLVKKPDAVVVAAVAAQVPMLAPAQIAA